MLPSDTRIDIPTNHPTLTPALSATSSDTSPNLSSYDHVVTPLTGYPVRDDSGRLPELRLDAGSDFGERDEFGMDDKASKSFTQSQRDGLTKFPECWGHRGASAAFPENTRASFIEACKAGAQGLETDIHVTADNRLVLFHDPDLSRTTDGKGKIKELPWVGVIENVRTIKAPHQAIPMFREVLEILLQDENRHVKLNLDCKVDNDPAKLFSLVRKELEKFDDWEELLAPRIIIGIWHPKFIAPARHHLPMLPLYAIVMSIQDAETYFWSCSGFSIWFARLVSSDGDRFRQRVREAGKGLCTWTVNDEWEMRECMRMGVDSVITDKPDVYVAIVKELKEKKTTIKGETALTPWLMTWTSLNYYTIYQDRESSKEREYLEKEGGNFFVPSC